MPQERGCIIKMLLPIAGDNDAANLNFTSTTIKNIDSGSYLERFQIKRDFSLANSCHFSTHNIILIISIQ